MIEQCFEQRQVATLSDVPDDIRVAQRRPPARTQQFDDLNIVGQYGAVEGAVLADAVLEQRPHDVDASARSRFPKASCRQSPLRRDLLLGGTVACRDCRDFLLHLTPPCR